MAEKNNIGKQVAGFIGVVFLLLGVLFGMQIMTFIFGNLSTTTSTFPLDSNTVINETGGFINSTGYTLDSASRPGFISPVITLAINATDGATISAGNYTVSSIGVVTNATAVTFDTVKFTYTYSSDSQAKISSDAVVNNSLTSIVTYTDQSNTQLNTAAIAITLLILIAIFGIFWKLFMSKDGISGSSGKENRNFG